MERHVTLLRPDSGEPQAQGSSPSLPTDLLSQAAERLRILALLYAFVFFMAGIFPMLVVPSDRAQLFSSFLQWGPSVIAIAVALLVAAVLRGNRVSLSAAMRIDLVFEVASSYGITMAEFADPRALDSESRVTLYHGLSWVAVWTLLFTIVIPSPPRRALIAALASVSAVPARGAFESVGTAHSLRSRRARAVVPCEGPQGPAAVGEGAVAAHGGGGRRQWVEPGTSKGVVGEGQTVGRDRAFWAALNCVEDSTLRGHRPHACP